MTRFTRGLGYALAVATTVLAFVLVLYLIALVVRALVAL